MRTIESLPTPVREKLLATGRTGALGCSRCRSRVERPHAIGRVQLEILLTRDGQPRGHQVKRVEVLCDECAKGEPPRRQLPWFV